MRAADHKAVRAAVAAKHVCDGCSDCCDEQMPRIGVDMTVSIRERLAQRAIADPPADVRSRALARAFFHEYPNTKG